MRHLCKLSYLKCPQHHYSTMSTYCFVLGRAPNNQTRFCKLVKCQDLELEWRMKSKKPRVISTCYENSEFQPVVIRSSSKWVNDCNKKFMGKHSQKWNKWTFGFSIEHHSSTSQTCDPGASLLHMEGTSRQGT